MDAIGKTVSGVIGCGAGFGDEQILDGLGNLPYAGIVGCRDMNFEEMLGITEARKDKQNLLLLFNGGHEWPPVDRFGLAIEWLLDQTKSTGLQMTDRGLDYVRELSADVDSGYLYKAFHAAGQMAKIKMYHERLTGLLDSIHRDKNFSPDSLQFHIVSDDEELLMNEFSTAFNLLLQHDQNNAGVTNWKKIMKKVQQMISEKGYRHYAGRRSLDHCVRVCQEYFSMLYGQQNFETAFKTAQVLTIFLPDAPTAFWLMAKANAGLKNKNECEKYLKQSIGKGLRYNEMIGQTLAGIFTREEINKIFSN